MTREEAGQIIATWLVSSKGAKGQRGYIEGWFDEEDVEAFRMAIEVLLAEKTGAWITEKRDPQDVYAHTYCSECDAYWSSPTLVDSFNFCPNCGAKMGK